MAFGAIGSAFATGLSIGVNIQVRVEVVRAAIHCAQAIKREDHNPNEVARENFVRLATPMALQREFHRQQQFDNFFQGVGNFFKKSPAFKRVDGESKAA